MRARPNEVKKHQLAWALRNEVSSVSTEAFKTRIDAFYATAYVARTSDVFQHILGVKPYAWLENQFLLDFSCIDLGQSEIFDSSQRVRYLLTQMFSEPKEILSPDIVNAAVFKLLHPRKDDRNIGFDLFDFCECWQAVTAEKIGPGHKEFFDDLLIEINSLDDVLTDPNDETSAPDTNVMSQLEQKELDWLTAMAIAIKMHSLLPAYPLARGPRLTAVRRIEFLQKQINRAYRLTPVNAERIERFGRLVLHLMNIIGCRAP